MAASETEVVNAALIELSIKTIASLSEDREIARVANIKYPRARRSLIRTYRWNFAKQRSVALAPESDAPNFGFTYKFTVPDDTLHVFGIFDENEPQNNYTSSKIPWKREDGFILCDENPLYIYYLKDITNTTMFDPLFDDALALKLAIDLAFKSTAGAEREEQLTQKFLDVMRKAKLANAIENMPETIEASEWIDSRFGDRALRVGPIVGT